jgi:hypothetical protein
VKGVRKAHLFKGTKGTISIKDARSAKGDVIGFRVYAVNLDGTLYDPDGRAFYVKVGDPQEDQVLNFEVTAFKQKGDSAIQNKDITYTKDDDTKVTNLDIVGYNAEADKEFKNHFINIQKKELTKGGQYHLQWYWAGKNPRVRRDSEGTNDHSTTSTFAPVEGTDTELAELFDFMYTPNDGTAEQPIDLGDATKCPWYSLRFTDGWINTAASYHGEYNNVKVTLLDAARLQNDSTYHLKLVVKLHDADGVVSVVNTIYVNVTKRMPNRLPEAFKVRIGQEDVVNKVCFYLRPSRESQTWDINNWFDVDATDGKYGLIDAIGLASADDDATAGKWNTGNYGNYVNGGYGGKEQARTTRSQGVNYTSKKSLRWAQDVRPYNFEEMFVGLVDENRVFDVDYKFVFPGAGSVKVAASAGYGEPDDAEADFTKDAVSLYSQKMPAPIFYTGLDELKKQTTLYPGYYLPLVYYGVMDKWNSTSKMLSVKAGYTYHDINFVMKNGKVVADEKGSTTDYEVTPNYFDANGNFVAEADAAFKCYFKCAIDNNFAAGFRTQLPASEFKQFKNDAWVDATVTVPTGEKADEIGLKSTNPIPYGIAFTLYVDSIGVTWVSNLAAYTQVEATGASYFMTNFYGSSYGNPGFTKAWTSNSSDRSKDIVKDKVDQNGKSFYTDTLTYMNPTLADYNTSTGFVFNSVVNNWGDKVRWLGLAGLTDPYIKKVTINKKSGKVELSEANKNLDRINDYFTVTPTSTVNGKFGLKFTPKVNSLNPTEFHMFEFELANKAKIVHQWGHSQDINTDAPKIYWGDPNSIDNINSARRSR